MFLGNMPLHNILKQRNCRINASQSLSKHADEEIDFCHADIPIMYLMAELVNIGSGGVASPARGDRLILSDGTTVFFTPETGEPLREPPTLAGDDVGGAYFIPDSGW